MQNSNFLVFFIVQLSIFYFPMNANSTEVYGIVALSLAMKLVSDAVESHKWEVNIGSSNCLVPSGAKPLTDPMLTIIYAPISRHQATMS